MSSSSSMKTTVATVVLCVASVSCQPSGESFGSTRELMSTLEGEGLARCDVQTETCEIEGEDGDTYGGSFIVQVFDESSRDDIIDSIDFLDSQALVGPNWWIRSFSAGSQQQDFLVKARELIGGELYGAE